ncbi:hypothetical protein M3Y97_00574600 [Aphelenchoides bicaudatus]|nr:hypothetical protein M3Y97_00574600 [Aphelenchoides bicaudatus]
MSKVETAKSSGVVDKKTVVPKTTPQLIWHYACLVCQTSVRMFKAFCQVVVILYQFLCLLYQYPNTMGYAMEVTWNSLMVCYRNGLWDPFTQKPSKESPTAAVTPPLSDKSNIVKQVKVAKTSTTPEKIVPVLPAAVPKAPASKK